MAVQASFMNWGSNPKASTLTQSLKTPVWQEKVPRPYLFEDIFLLFFWLHCTACGILVP